MLRKFPVMVLALALGAGSVLAQDPASTQNSQARNVVSGQKLKIKGVVVAKDADRFVVRDATGVDTNVVLAPSASVKTKGGLFGGGDTTPMSAIGASLPRPHNAGCSHRYRFGTKSLLIPQKTPTAACSLSAKCCNL